MAARMRSEGVGGEGGGHTWDHEALLLGPRDTAVKWERWSSTHPGRALAVDHWVSGIFLSFSSSSFPLILSLPFSLPLCLGPR